jgi:membrane protein implicated in regulation of membrane protease activity
MHDTAIFILYGVPTFIAGAVMSVYLGNRFGNLASSKQSNPSNSGANMLARPARMIGRRGAAMRDGSDGMSRIQVDGVEWPVSSNDNTPIHQGEILEVTAFDGTTLLTKKLTA